MLRMALALVLMLTLAPAGFAQEDTPAVDRSATGGAQTLEDIMARQAGQKLDDSFRSDAVGDPDNAASIAAQLGTLGGVSDAEMWRALRYGSADVKVSAGGEVATVWFKTGVCAGIISATPRCELMVAGFWSAHWWPFWPSICCMAGS